jgi:hypothetical protein
MALWDKVEKLDKSKCPTFQRLWTAYPSYADDPCDRKKTIKVSEEFKNQIDQY